jgi:hypothetical protein
MDPESVLLGVKVVAGLNLEQVGHEGELRTVQKAGFESGPSQDFRLIPFYPQNHYAE